MPMLLQRRLVDVVETPAGQAESGSGATSTTGTMTANTLTVACQGSDHGLWYAQGSGPGATTLTP